jgi:hypothetical protein
METPGDKGKIGSTNLSKVGEGGRGTREGLIRAVNNWIRIHGDSITSEGPSEFLCECGADDCYLTVELTGREYESMALGQNRVLLGTKHLDALDGHRVVAQHDGYVVLEPVG